MKLKKLLEQREVKQKEMKQLIDTAHQEERVLNSEERSKFDALEEEIRAIDDTIRAIHTQRSLDEDAPAEEEEQQQEENGENRDYEMFDAFLRDQVENRAEAPLTQTDNGAVIPTSIANKIIQKVVDISPIYHDADRYNVKGNLQIPYYDESTGDVEMSYAEEFTDGESTSGKFKSISLGGFLARAICDISKSLINNSQFNIVDFVVNRMAQSIARFLEKELLLGTGGKVEGLSTITSEMTITAASATAITADEIIDLQEKVPDVYQANAYFIMNKATRTAIRKLKDGQNNYLLNKDANSRWGYTLFGKDVYTSDNMPAIETGKAAIYYGDYTGLAVKVSEEINIEVLRETKARQHVVEVLGFVEFDAKIQNGQKIAQLKMA